MEATFTQTKYGDIEVVVVGGGVAGLTAAAYLAKAGASVTLCEKAKSVGGRAATRHYDGFLFNRGIHALYCGGAAEKTLADLEVSYSGGNPKGVFALRGGKFHPYPADPASLLHTSLFDLADKLELIRWFGALPRINPKELANVSTKEWLDRNIKRLNVRQFVHALARGNAYTSALELVSADMFVQKLQLQLKNKIVYIDGGWQTLVNGLRSAAERAGARIVSGKRVETIEQRDGRVWGVRLEDGTVVSASGVVVATCPHEAASLLDHSGYPALKEIVHNLVPAQVACLDVALSRLPSDRHPVVQDVDRPRLLTAQSLFSEVAPDGGAIVYTFKQLDPRQQTDPHDDERELEDLLDTVQPGWRDVLVERIFMPRIDAVGALPLASNGGFEGRPGPRVPGITNLYLAGDWVGPEGFLVDASFASARKAAELLLEQDHSTGRATEYAQVAITS